MVGLTAWSRDGKMTINPDTLVMKELLTITVTDSGSMSLLGVSGQSQVIANVYDPSGGPPVIVGRVEGSTVYWDKLSNNAASNRLTVILV